MSELGSELDPMQQSSLEFPPEAPTPDASPLLPATDGPSPKVEAQPSSPAFYDVLAFQTARALPQDKVPNLIEIRAEWQRQFQQNESAQVSDEQKDVFLNTNLILTQLGNIKLNSAEIAALMARLPADLQGPVRRALHIEEQPGEAVLSEYSAYTGPEVPDDVSRPLRKILGDEYPFGIVDAPLFRKILDASRSAQQGLALDIPTASYLYRELIKMGNDGSKGIDTGEFQELQLILTQIMNPKPTE